MKKLILLVTLFLPSVAFPALPPNFKVTNEMIYQKLVEIEKRQAVFEERFKQIDKRFEQIDKRFEQIDKRFEQVDRRLEELREDMNMRFEQHLKYLGWLIAGMFGMMATFVGLLIWDRRTIIAEAKRQTLEELEKEIEPEKLKKLLNVAREFAKENEKFREILKKEGLL
jgi:biopolymer transport protein ExbB/TolQ